MPAQQSGEIPNRTLPPFDIGNPFRPFYWLLEPIRARRTLSVLTLRYLHPSSFTSSFMQEGRGPIRHECCGRTKVTCSRDGRFTDMERVLSKTYHVTVYIESCLLSICVFSRHFGLESFSDRSGKLSAFQCKFRDSSRVRALFSLGLATVRTSHRRS